jgi:dTDP-4-dehydrorhamnose reductase
VRLLITGGTGVLGRALRPPAEAAGHELTTPARAELDLFDPVAVRETAAGMDAVLHLATRIQPLDRLSDLDA